MSFMGELFAQSTALKRAVDYLFHKPSNTDFYALFRPGENAPSRIGDVPLDQLVSEIVKRAKSLLEELPTQTPEAIVRNDTRYTNSFCVADLETRTHELFPAAYSAAYSLLDKRIVAIDPNNKDLPPLEHGIYGSAGLAIIPHQHCCQDKVRAFFTEAHKKNHLIGWRVTTLMAQGREQEAIDAFFDNYVQSQGRDYVVVEGERHVLGHDSDAWDLRKAYPGHDYRKDLEKIPESPVKQGLGIVLI
jgi:hypothetical protein